jgi:predicted enzyme involved in methoxymalonyl-ACP biosynthesis
MESDSTRFTLQVRLTDTLGDAGMICVVICAQEGEDWRIDTWLMSCRVLGRKVEEAVLEELVRNARERGLRRLVGSYLPTERNRLVEDLYGRLGFALLERKDDRTTHWALAVDAYAPRDLPLSVSRSGNPADPTSPAPDRRA